MKLTRRAFVKLVGAVPLLGSAVAKALPIEPEFSIPKEPLQQYPLTELHNFDGDLHLGRGMALEIQHIGHLEVKDAGKTAYISYGAENGHSVHALSPYVALGNATFHGKGCVIWRPY